MTPQVQPSAVVPTPTYLRPEARITKVMTGRMNLSGARDDSSDPTSTAGTLPMMIESVTPNSTWPKASAPRAAASGERDGLGQVGADQPVGADHRVQEQQQHDHQ